MAQPRTKVTHRNNKNASPKNDSGFQPLPENLKPTDRRGHRVHLSKAEIDGEVVPDHPQAVNTRGPKGFYHARNGGVEYYRTSMYTPTNMTDSKSDLRSRSESPRRARAAREKYWSYRHVNPHTQRNVFHLDMHPPTDREGNKRYWSQMLPVLPVEGHVFVPSKRDLFEQAQKWPRPPRRHYAERVRRCGHDNPRRMEERERFGMNDWWTCHRGSGPRKSAVTVAKYPKRSNPVLYGAGADGCRSTSMDESRVLPLLVQLDIAEADMIEGAFDGEGQADSDDYDEAGADIESDTLQNQRNNVDALFELAEQKHVLKQAAKRKKLQKQGWDVWEGDELMSPEAEWEDVNDDLDEWELDTRSVMSA